MNTANNKRRQETQAKISGIFMELLQSREITKITVSDICKRAAINRSTFYTNYADIYALADDLRKRLETEVTALYQTDIDNNENSNDFLRLFQHIYDNRDLYRIYFKLGYDTAHKVDLYDISLADRFFHGKYIDYHLEFFKAGFNAIVKKWLQDGCRETPEEMRTILENEYQGRMATIL